MRTLLIAPNWIGDALMAQPLLALLREHTPGQHITAIAPSWVAPVLQAMPEVDEVIATSLAHGKLQWRARLTLARTLREQSFDRAFVLPNSLKSALIPLLAGIPIRIGYLGEKRFGLLNRRLAIPDPAMPMVRRYATLASLAGIELPATLAEPRLHVTPADLSRTRLEFGLESAETLYAFCPGAEFGPAKRWPAGHFARLADLLLQEHPHARILLLGGPGDVAIATEIRTRALHPGRIVLLAGNTSLPQALALIAGADAVVSNDSGLMHVAAALQRPQVALFGSSDPRHTPPLSAKAQILWLQLECSPCFARTCPLGHLRCLNELEPARVATALNEALVQAPGDMNALDA